jgi:DNA-binding transcriptional ArsR family regulator
MSFGPGRDVTGPAEGAVTAPAPGTPENPLPITDPRMMRGLAHPARIAILEHLVLDGPATATECAGIAGLSPSACSYHLRALARYGFAEEDPQSAADGRHRPWRAKISAFSFGERTGEPTALRAAGRVLRGTLQARIERMRRRFADEQECYPLDWQSAAGLTQDYVHVTAAELEDLRRKVLELTARYRRLDPAERPEGARRVLAVTEVIPAFAPDADR